MRSILFAAALAAWPAAASASECPGDDVAAEQQAASDGTRSTVHRVRVAAPSTDVWQALATAEGWRTWAAPFATMAPGSDLLETSYELQGAAGRPGNIVNRLVLLDAPRALTFSTVKAPQGSFLDTHIATLSRVEWRIDLLPEGTDETCVRLTGSGYASGAAGDQILDFFLAGNGISLRQLRARFATGPLDWARVLAPAGAGGGLP